ncbi:putative SMC3 [Ceraceosorus guamensis]|uniref:Structural maintenance of chromosomes protein n=1 Tax=Ceraceosorus guamensis TaxID=1522189 RepID=A0A316W4Z2_9BASI|nr:putative SMC3 [Ceraceosorus guamensis]PWN42705.1 putative SMC3 [Ceraceosorus guamensis]
MHIKTLTIQGFKSYRDQTAIDELSPGSNVVVGRNGSGKSNFFSAIRFVLSDAYTSMSREERQALLHDSSSSTSTTLSAFVEIVFDNSDGRFPVAAGTSGSNSDEVILRRTIGLKKDEYSIDRRSANKADVANLLEAAGFSRSNPYYIVPQGRITNLTNMKDRERLDLLKEVAGTRVYETRRAESLKIMEETDSKRSKIDDLLKYIEERLAELDDEKEELRQYYDKDKERRCLEYALYYRSLQDHVAKLEELEEKRRGEAESSTAKQRTFNQREQTLASLKSELQSLQQEAAQLEVEQTTVRDERRSLIRIRATLESLVGDDEEEGGEAERSTLEAALRSLDERIAASEAELINLLPAYEEKRLELEEARNELEQIRNRINVLLGRQGRSTAYTTQAARDAALRAEINSLQQHVQRETRRKAELQSEQQAANTALQEARSGLEGKAALLEERRIFNREAAQEWEKLSSRREELLEQKKGLWKEETKLSSTATFGSENLASARRALAGTMGRATALGLQAVEDVAKRHKLEGVFGPLYQLFAVDEKYKVAVETTAGESLFHIVVDTDETATKLLDVMTREKLGRVTVIPLNRIKPKEVNFPQAADAILMIKKLEYDRKYVAALQQVFGKTIICPNLEIAGAYVRSHGLNAITLDGDRVERKGSLHGGYHDPRRSRLDAVRDVKKWREVYETSTSSLKEVKTAIQQVEQEVATIEGSLQKLKVQSIRAAATRDALIADLSALREDEGNARRRMEHLHDAEAGVEREIDAARLKVQALQQELQTPLSAGLSNQESAELDQLNARLDAQRQVVAEQSATLSELASQKRLLEIELDDNLKRERDGATARLEALNAQNLLIAGEAGAAAGATSAESRKRELANVKRQIGNCEKRLTALEKEQDELQKKVKAAEERHEKTRSEQVADAREIERGEKSLQRYLSQKQIFSQKRDEENKNIRDLGVLPDEAFEKYLKTNKDKILTRLHKVKHALSKFSNVNKKAVEQYNNFTKQRDQLLQRQEELEASASSIQELIEVLDQRKDEAIERTFKQVSKYFAEVFERLVPAGKGRLIMQKRIDEPDDMDEDEDGAEKSTVENYTGVSIKVSFNSKVDEGLRIQQLSGGQKSLVALATVFAIQKCDPAPFYLFDEIDANLDAQYRTAVAAMISELSESAQFITTTFRPEMVAVADKHYGVLFNQQKISSIRSISQDEAATFVEAAAEGPQPPSAR